MILKPHKCSFKIMLKASFLEASHHLIGRRASPRRVFGTQSLPQKGVRDRKSQTKLKGGV